MVLSWPVNVLKKYLYFGLKAESLSQRLERPEQKHDDLVIKVSSRVGSHYGCQSTSAPKFKGCSRLLEFLLPRGGPSVSGVRIGEHRPVCSKVRRTSAYVPRRSAEIRGHSVILS
jgi:hypothetical protein